MNYVQRNTVQALGCLLIRMLFKISNMSDTLKNEGNFFKFLEKIFIKISE